MRLHVGCAQWTHAAWRGRYLPHPLPPGERLRAYASWCTAVEGNTTFYATPSRETAESWAAQVGEDFRFVLKLPKTVTGWLAEGRSPTVFVHTPDNADALALARRFHQDVRARVPGLEPLPDPEPTEEPTLF